MPDRTISRPLACLILIASIVLCLATLAPIAPSLCSAAEPEGGQTDADHFGPVEASGIRWLHLSSRNGDLPVPGTSSQQTGAVVADLDKDGVKDFVLAFRKVAPALVWYRETNVGWDRYVIERDFLSLEAGGAVLDIDRDGFPDLVFGDDAQGPNLWWWKNPGARYDPAVSWMRYTIKKTGGKQHHDQIFGDFKGTGRPQLVYWNQKAGRLFIADIPPNPTQVSEWPAAEIFAVNAGETNGKSAEGLDAADIDGDGKIDLLAGNYWFKHTAGNTFKPIRVSTIGGRIAAAKLIKNAKYPQIIIAPGDGVGPLQWYDCNADPQDPNAWTGHDLLGRDMNHGHSLQIADIDNDGNLDIFAEMVKWTDNGPDPDNPRAEAVIFFGDGAGHFRRTVFSTGFDYHEARVADLNGDGTLDILDKPYSWDTSRVDLWLNKGPAARKP